ncbi:hypothetical protein [Desulfosediminicola flagellatus]|uniref:hypothetical protein n=1 Tax=Desulfosediminicola flagellatus TaxID=2569541 RepID=UPI0010AB65FE|nr:hypothetical protein [Desulfosediminicola flagellatus]
MFNNYKFIPFMLVVALSCMSVFWFNDFAIKNELAYRQLANGWVSIYPDIHMDESLSVIEKIKNVIEEDIVHGRFRPAFFTYISASYMISPVVHNRLSEMPGRSYKELMTGDLRIFSYILLVSIALSMVLMAHLIFRLTGSIIFSIIPIFFIPLSPSLTENLLQNYIDSQEIPLMLWLSVWIYSFFVFLNANFKSPGRTSALVVSLLSLLLLFLTKETAVVLVGGHFILLLLMYMFKKVDLANFPIYNVRFLWVTLLSSAMLALSVVLITSMNKSGYANAYHLDFSKLVQSIKKLWTCTTQYSLNHYFSYTPVCVALVLLVAKRREKFNDISVYNHLLFFVLLLSLSIGFFLILIPWDPVLTKYTYPSVFLFSFLVSYSLSVVYCWAKTLPGKYIKVAVLSYSFVYIYMFFTILPAAASMRDYSTEVANYGIETIHDLSNNMDNDILRSGRTLSKILFVCEEGNEWHNPLQLHYLHLARYINFNKHYNINAKNGQVIENIKMPKGELTSFKRYNGNPGVYISTKITDLDKYLFNSLYVAHLNNKQPEERITSSISEYVLTPDCITYHRKPHFESFSIYKYLPVVQP